jgi:hypothetical protein
MAIERAFFFVEGMDGLLRKLDPDTLLGPWRQILDDFGQYAEGVARSRIPTDTGAAARTLHWRIQNKPVPRWVRVGFNVKVKKGFRVMGALEGGGIYHYSSGARKGSQTKGYWSGLRNVLTSRTDPMAADAAARIEALWAA